MAKLREEGFETIRASGSHGTFDIVAIDKQRKIIRLVQVKGGKSQEREKARIEDMIQSYTGPYYVVGVIA